MGNEKEEERQENKTIFSNEKVGEDIENRIDGCGQPETQERV